MTSALKQFFPGQSIEPVVNFGGFVNSSYRIGDSLHLKLGNLAMWRRWADHLWREHRAPRLLDWVEVDGQAGALFERLPGTAPTRLSPELRADVMDALTRLHNDEILAAGLDPAGTCADVYFAGYDDRFREDLASIQPVLPPEDFDFLASCVAKLADTVRGSPSFAEPAVWPTHGDLWLENLLCCGTDWWILDWDDLGLGDPMQDHVMLLGPTRERVALPSPSLPGERFAVLSRAAVLDWAIDTLADWVEAEGMPEFRAEKARLHQEALALCRTLW